MRSPLFGCTLLAAAHLHAAAPATNQVDRVVEQVKAAWAAGKTNETLALLAQAIATEPENARGYFIRARIYEEMREHEKSIADYNQVLKLDPRIVDPWQRRATELFKLGRVAESLADFDKFLTLVPAQAPYNWQRGIACYYAGQFDEGRKQFELHQTVNPNDVENAVWHFLCVARSAGIERARATLIPIKADSRIPMKEVHALFAGKGSTAQVLAAAADGNPAKEDLERRLFYAHLYLALYDEARGETKTSWEHIAQAVARAPAGDYMGDVARVHAQLRRPADAK